MDSKDGDELQRGETLDDMSGPVESDNTMLPIPPERRGVAKKYVVIAGGIVVFAALAGVAIVSSSKKTDNKPTTSQSATTAQSSQTQALDQKTLDKLHTASAPDSPQGQLTISSSVLFKSTMEVQGNTKLDKDLAVGGNATVNGTTVMQGPVGINNNLAVRGALSVGGPLNAPTLNVGSLTVTNMNISGNFNFGGHILPNGATPSARISAAAGGGTVTVSGNDTAGTIIINAGGASGPGEMAIVTFRSPFSTTPHVQLTPINGASAALNYFTTRSSNTFSVETGSNTTPGTTYGYDYLVTQ
jgi:hypothetical protein